MKKTIRISCMLFLGILMSAQTGCSGDDKDEKDEMEYYDDWREGPEEFYIIRSLSEEGTGADARMLASVIAAPVYTSEQWEAYGCPPLDAMDTHLGFGSSELAGEYAGAAYCPVTIKKFRKAVLKGLWSADASYYSCVVEPYYGADVVLEGAKGVIIDCNFNRFPLVSFELEGQEYLALLLNLDSKLNAKAGQQVTLSGRVFSHAPLISPEEIESWFKVKSYIWLTDISMSE